MNYVEKELREIKKELGGKNSIQKVNFWEHSGETMEPSG